MAYWICLHCCGEAGNNCQADSRPAEPPGSSSVVFTRIQQQLVPALCTWSVPVLFSGIEISLLREFEVLRRAAFHQAVLACGVGGLVRHCRKGCFLGETSQIV